MSDRISFSRLKRHFRRRQRLPEQPNDAQSNEATPIAISPATTSTVQRPTTTLESTLNEPVSALDVNTGTPRSESLHCEGVGNASSLTTPATAAPGDVTSVTPTTPERLWDKAYDALKEDDSELVQVYEKILSGQLEGGVGSDVREAQPNTIAQHDPVIRRSQMVQLVHAGLQKTAREAKFKEGVGTAFTPIMTLKDTISTAVQAIPQASLPWSGVCVLLELLVNPIQQMEANRDGVLHIIKWMDWYLSLSTSLIKDFVCDTDEIIEVRHQLEGQTVDLYTALLSYQMKSVYTYYRHRGLVFLRDLVNLDDWDGNMEAVSNAESRFRKYSKFYTTQQTNACLEELVMSQRSKRDRQCIQDMRLTNPEHDKTRIEESKGGLLRDSYRWILDNEDYRRWNEEPDHHLLWIKGDPGKGKTMLLCGVIDEWKSTPSGLLSFFFCQATESRLNTATSVLRGLLYMLINQQPSLLPHVRKRYDDAGKSLFEDSNAWVALSEVFTSILQDPASHNACFVVDALDECIADLHLLLKFISQSASSFRAKWMVSSRNWRDIEEQLDRATQGVRLCLELNETSVSAALSTYIRHKVDELEDLKEYDTQTKNTVRDYLSSNANGTFLWAALVCQELSGPGVRKVHTKFILENKFPPGLDPLYNRMMGNINDRDKDTCAQILALLAITYRPLGLQELAHLVEPLAVFEDDLKILEDAIGSCGSFLSLRKGIVYFVHQSAKDFLVGKAADKIFPSGLAHVHRSTLLRSLRVLQETLRKDIYDLRRPGVAISQVSPPDPDPLARVRYSCVYWVDHLFDYVYTSNTTLLHESSTLIEDAIVAFLEKKFLYWLEALSLLRSLPAGIIAIERLDRSFETTTQLTDLIRDSRRFTLAYGGIMEEAPLQAYTSALLFSPTCSKVRENFKSDEPSCITTKPIVGAQWGACLKTLEGHKGPVISVAFSPDSNSLISASYDCTIKLWNVSSGKCVQTFEGHESVIESVVFSPNGKVFASASWDQTVKLWDPTAGSRECLQTLKGHNHNVTSVAFSPNGELLASASDDYTIKFWDITSGICYKTLEGGRFSEIAFSPDSKQLASSSCGEPVRLLDVSSGERIHTFMKGTPGANGGAFCFHGNNIVSTNEDTIDCWDTVSGKCIWSTKDHEVGTQSLRVSPNGKILASAPKRDKVVQIWDIASEEMVQTLQGHRRNIYAVTFSPNGKLLASASSDESIKLWDTNLGQYRASEQNSRQYRARRSERKAHNDYPVSEVALSGNGNLLMSISSAVCELRETASGRCIKTFEKDIYHAIFSPDSRLLATKLDRGPIELHDTTFQEPVQTLEDHGYNGRLLAFSSSSRLLAAASSDKTIKIWCTYSNAYIRTLEGHCERLNLIDFSNDKFLMSASDDNSIRVWDTDSGKCIQNISHGKRYYRGHTKWASLSPNGKLVASIPTQESIQLWNVASGQCIATLAAGRRTYSQPIVFSSDSKNLVSFLDGCIRIWDTNSGICMQTIGVDVEPLSMFSESNLLLTNHGYIDLSVELSGNVDNDVPVAQDSLQISKPKWRGYGLTVDFSWITYNGENLVWIPVEYRPQSLQPGLSAVFEDTIAIGCASAEILVIGFSGTDPGHIN